MDPSLLNLKTVRRALRDWSLLSSLGESPLSGLGIVQARLNQAGYTASPAGRGLALREQIQAAIDLLRPDGGSPEPYEKRWRPYLIITEQYLQNRNPEFVQSELQISRGTYFEEQNRALLMLVDILKRMEEQIQLSQKEGQPLELQPARPAQRPVFLAPAHPAYDLIGRDELVGELKQRLLAHERPPVLALHGLPGVGKTRIAVELANDGEVLERYCDGVLWAGLGRQPDVLAQLGLWASAVGLPFEAITNCRDLLGRAELIHTAIGMRRMLLVLDDAWQADAALALKIGGPGCAYLLTTRRADIALDFSGENVWAVHELELEDGLDLLFQAAPHLAGAGREETVELVRSVGGLPLAVILMGRYLHKQSYGAQARRLNEALARLKLTEARLNLAQAQSPLEAGHDYQPDIPYSLKKVIGLSDMALDAAAHQALLSLVFFPPKPNTFSETAALAVIGQPVEVLDRLVDCGLVEPQKPGRYSLHQTITDYASLQEKGPGAAERMLAYFVEYTAGHADQFDDLELELNNIQAALAIANQANQFSTLIALVSALYPFLETRGLFTICEQQLALVSEIADNLGDQEERAYVLHWLGSFVVKRGHFEEALGYLQSSILLAQAARTKGIARPDLFSLYGVRTVRPVLDDELRADLQLPPTTSLYGVRSASLEGKDRLRALEGHNLFDLGMTRMYMGYFIEGCAYIQNALQIYQELGLLTDQGQALNALGYAYEEICDYAKSRATLEEALRVCRLSRNGRGEGWAQQNLSMLCLSQGDFSGAAEHSGECLEIYARFGDKRGTGWQLHHQARIQRQIGNYAPAEENSRQALAIFTEIGDWMGRAFTTQLQGLIHTAFGENEQAADDYTQALQIFEKIQCKAGIAQYYQRMGALLRANDDAPGAVPYLERGLELAREIMFSRGESACLAELGLAYLRLGENSRAQESGLKAVRIAVSIGARPAQARARLALGQIYLENGCLAGAENEFRQSLDLRKALGQEHLTAEPAVGLANATRLDTNAVPLRV